MAAFCSWGRVVGWILAALFVAVASTSFSFAQSSPVDRVFFGLHIHRSTEGTPWPDVPFGSWRLWDARVQWPHLQPQRARWDFRKLDKLLDLAESRGVNVLLPLGLSPTWASARPDESSAYKQPGWASEPREMNDWRVYVRAVVSRYKGRIGQYEIWNEPNLTRFYSGTVETMVQLTCEAAQVIHEVDPTARVVSPAATEKDKGVAWLAEFLDKGGGRCVDVVGFHYYTFAHEKPELIDVLTNRIRTVMKSHGIGEYPIWNTESGWYFANRRIKNPSPYKVIDLQQSAGYLARAHIVAAGAGVSRFYWYSWDNTFMGGLVEPDDPSETKPAAGAYRQIVSLLQDKVVEKCDFRVGGLALCRIRDPSNVLTVIAWGTNGPLRWQPDEQFRFRAKYRLDGRGSITPVEAGSAIDLDEIPLVLQ